MLRLLFFLSLFSLILGPAIYFPLEFPTIKLYLSDILIGLNACYWLLNFKLSIEIIRKNLIAKSFFLFSLIALLSLALSPLILTPFQKLVSLLYLIRLFAYFTVYLTTVSLQKQKLFSPKIIKKYLIISTLCLSSFGWLQYFLYPDLRNLFYLGWDPHYKRIFSTFYDPNFLGLILTLSLILIFTSFSFSFFPTLFIFFTLLFTYSRSSFLSFILSITYYYLNKKKYLTILCIWITLGIGIILLPRPAGVGVKLERIFSLEERLISMKQGLKIFSDYPFLGVGFNTLRFAKKEYGFLSSDWEKIHSGAGIENSFIFLSASTGIFGVIAYLFFLFQIFKKSSPPGKTSIIAIIIHSLFLNSFFFPPIMIWFWIITATENKLPFSQSP